MADDGDEEYGAIKGGMKVDKKVDKGSLKTEIHFIGNHLLLKL